VAGRNLINAPVSIGLAVVLAVPIAFAQDHIFSDGFESGNTSAWSEIVGGVWKPTPGTTWQWQLDGTIDTSFDVEMYDIDLIDPNQQVFDTLHAAGRIVVCYFSAGTYENWRPDADDFPLEVLGNGLGWPGELWLDIRRLDILGPIMEARLDLAAQRGCDGVEPDNVDGYANETGFALTAQDQLAYNIFLATEAHSRGLSVGLKNDLDQIAELLPHFDWALNEECWAYDECDALDPFVAAGKAVFGVEYEGEPSDFCPTLNAKQFSWLKKNPELDAWRVDCRGDPRRARAVPCPGERAGPSSSPGPRAAAGTTPAS
jgi:endo-alpha-1,4-polygalactosaminidase (GH114 family)